MELARMTSKGQLTIPVSIRRKLGVDTGDQLLFYEKNGQIIIANASPSALAEAQVAAAEPHVYSIDEIRRIAVPIAKEHRAAALILFGSYARGEATSDSRVSPEESELTRPLCQRKSRSIRLFERHEVNREKPVSAPNC